MWTQSLTPASSTLWLPTGRPALVSLSTARLTSGVISLGWLKWRLIHSGWYFSSISHSSSSIRWGRKTGTREPIRMISMCGISRSPRRIDSNSFGASVRPSPPEMRTSRTCGVPAQVLELGLVVAPVEVLGRVADDPRPRAVAAVAGALGRDQHQDAIRVAMDEAGHRRVAILGERVLHHRGEGLVLATARDDLAADRVVGVLGVDQADEVGRDVDPELVGCGQAVPLVIGQLEHLLDLGEVVDPMAELPPPVVPLRVGDVVPDRRPAADGRGAVGTDRERRISQVDERGLGRAPGGFLVRDRCLDLLGVQRGEPPGSSVEPGRSGPLDA